MIQKRDSVGAHLVDAVLGRIVEFGRSTVAAVVERKRAPAGGGKRGDPAGCRPIRLFVRREAVDEQDRLALPLVELGDLGSVVAKSWHGAAN
jgi:hypothetical protein